LFSQFLKSNQLAGLASSTFSFCVPLKKQQLWRKNDKRKTLFTLIKLQKEEGEKVKLLRKNYEN